MDKNQYLTENIKNIPKKDLLNTQHQAITLTPSIVS